MEKEVVSNSSTIIFLAKLELFHLAKNIFAKILLPKAVIYELFKKNCPENEIIRKELNSFLFEHQVTTVKDFSLDEGEKEAISLCLEKNIKIFLSDDKKARVYAKSFGLNVIGMLGILLTNFEEKKITKKEFLELLNKLVEKGYYLSPQVYNKVIKLIK